MARNGPAIPRYRATGAPAILHQGFRPFFLGAGLWAVLAMALWIGQLRGMPLLPQAIGQGAWHAHAMLFGYLGAALAGFLTTAVPNWTGRMPIQGLPLAGLAGLWLAGRIGVLAMDRIGLPAAAVLDVAFIVVLGAAIGREIVAGRNWRNLPVLAGIAVFAVAHVLFWLGAAGQLPTGYGERLAVGVFTVLIGLIGGRIVPSFTRNWLKKQGAQRFPTAATERDRAVLIGTGVALGAWLVAPDHAVTAVLCAAAALAQVWRLSRWRGLATWREPLLLVLHLGYLWVPVGLALIAAAPVSAGVTPTLALHALTTGAMGTMTLAVMMRASRGHTGRPLAADTATTAAIAALQVAVLARLLAPIFPLQYVTLLGISGAGWIGAFALFCLAYGRMLVTPKPD